MLVSAMFLAYCDHEALMLGHWPPRGPILQLKGLHVATVAFTSDVLLQESFFVGFHSFLPRGGVWKNCSGTVDSLVFGAAAAVGSAGCDHEALMLGSWPSNN